MPSVSAAQHRWIGWLKSNPEEARKAGLSSAKVDEWLHADKGSPWKKHAAGGLVGYDSGGGVDPTAGGIGGYAPSVQSMNPMVRGLVQRYSSLPTERLQELASTMGGSPQGQIVQRVLQQRLAMPNTQPQQPIPGAPPPPGQQAQPAAQQPMPDPVKMGIANSPYAAGGGVPRRALGGPQGMSLSQADPWWTRADARQIDSSGFLHGSSMGRADSITTTAPGGAYVIPADVVSGLGEGNSLAGARILQEALATGPWGTPLTHPFGRYGGSAMPRLRVSAGGRVAGEDRPVKLSHGEFVVQPHEVAAIGGGDHKAGIRELDAWVQMQRRKQINELKKLPGPVGAKPLKQKAA